MPLVAIEADWLKIVGSVSMCWRGQILRLSPTDGVKMGNNNKLDDSFALGDIFDWRLSCMHPGFVFCLRVPQMSHDVCPYTVEFLWGAISSDTTSSFPPRSHHDRGVRRNTEKSFPCSLSLILLVIQIRVIVPLSAQNRLSTVWRYNMAGRTRFVSTWIVHW